MNFFSCLKPSSFIRAWERLYFITQAELKKIIYTISFYGICNLTFEFKIRCQELNNTRRRGASKS